MERPVVEATDVDELETRGRYLRRRGFGGYRSEDVDALLVEASRAVRDLLTENEGLRAGVSPDHRWWPMSSGRMTPFDIQDRRFRRARVGGYDMRSVDEYLDDLTELLTVLLQENERLRASSSGSDGGPG
jgi:DivIVA domain-containing protein